MSQTAAQLVLTDDHRAELGRWSQDGSPMLAERARIVLACAEPGAGIAKVATGLPRCCLAFSAGIPPRLGENDSHRSQLLPTESRTHALSQVSSTGSVREIGRAH